jgi:NAD(P)-dependent dehydrogenase (short-subunit alcohol dehydrogenase family)
MSDRPLALVTGAAHRLGKAFALALAGRGYAICLHYLNSARAANQTESEIRALGVPAYKVRVDLRDPERIPDLFAFVDRLDEPLQVLVNSAAVMAPGTPADLALEDWDAALELNLRAPFLCARLAAQRMQSGGLIVNVSDVGARKAWSMYPSYTVSKAGLESLTRLLARALAPSIRVNAIAPGLVLPAETMDPQEWQRLIGRLPLKRAGRPEEIASALEFLLANEYVTGQTIVVDGGYSLLG